MFMWVGDTAFVTSEAKPKEGERLGIPAKPASSRQGPTSPPSITPTTVHSSSAAETGKNLGSHVFEHRPPPRDFADKKWKSREGKGLLRVIQWAHGLVGN